MGDDAEAGDFGSEGNAEEPAEENGGEEMQKSLLERTRELVRIRI